MLKRSHWTPRAGRRTGKPMHRTMRGLVRVLVVGSVTLLVLLLAGGWFFSSQIRAGALDVEPASDEMTLRVVEASASSMTLTETAGVEDPLRDRATYGVAWDTGYGQVSGPARVHGSEVTRDFVLLAGSLPGDGQEARLDRDAFPEDPSLTLASPVEDVTY